MLETLQCEQKLTTTMLCDNNSTIKLSKNPVLHGRSKHIDMKFHLLRDLSKDGIVELKHCKSEDLSKDGIVEGSLHENKICKLNKFLYGLKQPPMQWHEKFDNLVTSHGFKINEISSYTISRIILSTLLFAYACMICLSLILIFEVVKSVKNMFCEKSDMKDRGKVNITLKIKII